jgi:hypothetical protein
MTISLTDYTPKIRDNLKRGGFACVYIVQAGGACKLGFASDLVPAFTKLQRVCPIEVRLIEALWVPDMTKAKNIMAVVQDTLPGKRDGGWFDLKPDDMAFELHVIANRVCPGVAMATHAELLGQWRAGRVREREQACTSST